MYDSSNVNVLQMRLYTLSSHKTDEYVTSNHSKQNNHFVSCFLSNSRYKVLHFDHIVSMNWTGIQRLATYVSIKYLIQFFTCHVKTVIPPRYIPLLR